jgi:hypothetical protein
MTLAFAFFLTRDELPDAQTSLLSARKRGTVSAASAILNDDDFELPNDDTSEPRFLPLVITAVLYLIAEVSKSCVFAPTFQA